MYNKCKNENLMVKIHKYEMITGSEERKNAHKKGRSEETKFEYI
jgi:hypothetical protein